jgi:hypothetical protein
MAEIGEADHGNVIDFENIVSHEPYLDVLGEIYGMNRTLEGRGTLWASVNGEDFFSLGSTSGCTRVCE